MLGFGFSSPQKGNNRVARERPRPPPRGSVLRERHAVALRGRIERGRCPARRCRCGLTHLHKRDRCRNEHDDCRNERDYGCPASRSKRQTPAALVGAAGGEAQRAAQGTELVRFAQHTRVPAAEARGPQNTAPPSATHRVQQHRVSLEASRERGGAHARFSTLAPQPLSEPMAAAHRACEACLLRSVRHLNDAATPTPLSLGAHLGAYTSLSLTLRRLLRCAKPSARRPIAIAARKKAGLGARCSRGDPRAHFSDGRACPT